jgi:hypothetical protein
MALQYKKLKISIISLLMRGSSHRSPELLAWYEVRDNLLGANYMQQDIKKALELAAICQHPDAVWLNKLFAGCDVKTPERQNKCFWDCEGDPRALCFSGLIDRVDEAILQRAAEKGCAYAQAWMTGITAGDEMFL